MWSSCGEVPRYGRGSHFVPLDHVLRLLITLVIPSLARFVIRCVVITLWSSGSRVMKSQARPVL
jgi:hypothetical protein